ncbi:hypothetical protein O7635_36615 [Asanoa sp. WMMD1127]|uniref:hypothetical protein n=1 Tax=Asanoa sp. WMMD1127 TaxID=3016107 RepID=UPI002417A430|nr:hypothetical protein [Asanoa sp. WMMD1127]MDG4827399.1 hypothetical protein [Asanoa sp. WMMD1127]
MTDTMMASIGAAVEQGRAGQRAQARETLTTLWSATDDPLHRCSIAHYLADLQDDPAAELLWDERALAAVTDLTDERAQRFHADLRVRGFLPSLRLNLADVHRRLGHPDEARRQVAAAEELLGDLPEGDYGAGIRAALAGVTALLAEGSTERLT